MHSFSILGLSVLENNIYGKLLLVSNSSSEESDISLSSPVGEKVYFHQLQVHTHSYVKFCYYMCTSCTNTQVCRQACSRPYPSIKDSEENYSMCRYTILFTVWRHSKVTSSIYLHG